MSKITVIYYTSNYLDHHNPVFLENTREALFRAVGEDTPIISVSQEPIKVGSNICIGNIGRSHLNIYRQMLIGAKAATTSHIALAEDDIFYSYEHFHSDPYIEKYPDVMLYDMNKLSLFTWTKPPLYSFRHDRMVVNQLIAPRQRFIDALEERFRRVDELLKIWPLEKIIKYWGDLGRYEALLGVTVQPTKTFMSTCPSIVFSHEHAYGYLSQGKKKRLGDLRIIEVPYWGRAEDMAKRFYEK